MQWIAVDRQGQNARARPGYRFRLVMMRMVWLNACESRADSDDPLERPLWLAVRMICLPCRALIEDENGMTKKVPKALQAGIPSDFGYGRHGATSHPCGAFLEVGTLNGGTNDQAAGRAQVEGKEIAGALSSPNAK